MMCDVVGELLGLVHVVRGQHHRDAVAAQLARPGPRWRAGPAGPGRRSARRRRPARGGRRRPWRAPSRCCWPPESRRYGVRPQSPSPSRSTSMRDVERVRVQRGDVAQHLHRARTPDQAPPSCSITPMRGSSVGARRRPGRGPRTRTRARCGSPVALAGLERGGLAGAVGAEDRGDRCRARRVRSSPSTATLSPYACQVATTTASHRQSTRAGAALAGTAGHV